ncbi:MAG TPA: hypothetical protein VHC22_15870 [Pirellulales bacterium]|nr:hypothetical protein [Pirellulales bacterium]
MPTRRPTKKTVIAATAAVLVVLSLGTSWRLWFHPFVDGGSVVVGRPFTIRGCLIEVDGPQSDAALLRVTRRTAAGEVVHYSNTVRGGLTRSLFCRYPIAEEIPALPEAGEYHIELRPFGRTSVHGRVIARSAESN